MPQVVPRYCAWHGFWGHSGACWTLHSCPLPFEVSLAPESELEHGLGSSVGVARCPCLLLADVGCCWQSPERLSLLQAGAEAREGESCGTVGLLLEHSFEIGESGLAMPGYHEATEFTGLCLCWGARGHNGLNSSGVPYL